jgi:hypothetical protein
VEYGWTSLILSIWFVGRLQLLGIGIIGESIGEINNEVKNGQDILLRLIPFHLINLEV